jgi:5-methylcytosine-specific restriction enzyme subunit McrC
MATAEAGDKVLNLLARMLFNGTQQLIKQGLLQAYQRQTTPTDTIKGKINITASVKQDLLRQGKAICTFDSLTTDILPNQLLKSTIVAVLQTNGLAAELQPLLRKLLTYLEPVRLIRIEEQLFYQLPKRFPVNKYYQRVLPLCRLLHQNLLPDPTGAGYTLQNFVEDERQMGRLFEYFIRNFMRLEQQVYQVKSERISWQTTAGAEVKPEFLPQMLTDISLTSPHRKIIIDTKFYKQALVQRYDKPKLIAPHLYQLFAYLKNHAATPPGLVVEGILLYPVVTQELDLTYPLQGHNISIRTINLAQPWPHIKADLLKLLP